MSYGIGRRRGSDPAWLWLWCRLAAAALIQPVAWEPPYVMGEALKYDDDDDDDKAAWLMVMHRNDNGMQVVVTTYKLGAKKSRDQVDCG